MKPSYGPSLGARPLVRARKPACAKPTSAQNLGAPQNKSGGSGGVSFSRDPCSSDADHPAGQTFLTTSLDASHYGRMRSPVQ
jgi:hypothetical protein